MATTLASQVQELYVGYLGRAADKAGLDFWVKAIESGTSTLESVALGFTLSEEYKAQYNGLTTTQLVAKVYQNVLGRAADADGLAFWAGEVNKGVIKADTLVKTMIGSLGAIDQLTIDNKVAAANAYTIAAGDKYSVEAGKAAVVNAGTTVPGTSTPGQTFTLTNVAGSPDSLSPTAAVAASKTTAGDDVIRAVAAGDLATVDYVDAGGGNDTLNATMGNAAAKPVIKNVEIFNITAAAAAAAGTDTLDLGDVTGLKELNSTTTGGVNNAYYSNIALGTKLGLDGTTGAATNTFVFKAAQVTGAADSVDLALKGAAGTGAVTINAIETINVATSAKTGVAAANNLVLAGTTVENVNISGDKAASFNLTGVNTTLVKVDASSATANLTVDLKAALTNDVTVKLGSGADTIDFTGSGAKKVTLETGAGNDTVLIDAAGKHAIDLGEGKDTLTIKAHTVTSVIDASTAAKLAASVVKVANFTSGSDVLRVDSTAAAGAGNEVALTGTQLTAIADSTVNVDLLAAANAAHAAATTANGGALAAGDFFAFQYAGNSYVLVEAGAVGGGAVGTFTGGSDFLIELTGVTSLTAADVVGV